MFTSGFKSQACLRLDRYISRKLLGSSGLRGGYNRSGHWKGRREKPPPKVLGHKAKPVLRFFQLSMELIVLVAACFLASHHVKDLLVLLVAGGTLRVALAVRLKAVLMVAVQAEKVHSWQLKFLAAR